jgi:hypothetical protein
MGEQIGRRLRVRCAVQGGEAVGCRGSDGFQRRAVPRDGDLVVEAFVPADAEHRAEVGELLQDQADVPIRLVLVEDHAGSQRGAPGVGYVVAPQDDQDRHDALVEGHLEHRAGVVEVRHVEAVEVPGAVRANVERCLRLRGQGPVVGDGQDADVDRIESLPAPQPQGVPPFRHAHAGEGRPQGVGEQEDRLSVTEEEVAGLVQPQLRHGISFGRRSGCVTAIPSG